MSRSNRSPRPTPSEIHRLAARRIPYIVSLVALIALGCAAQGGAAPDRMPEGINDSFLSQDMSVEDYVERFEGESRAVYAERHAIVEALALEPGDQIADIGAGTGFFSVLFAEAVTPSGRVDAVEISPNFLEHLRTVAGEIDTGNLEVVEGTAKSVSLPPDSVDAAFICDVYHHFEHPEDSLASLREAIRSQGSLYLLDFHRIPGVSPDWLLKHVRAGREVFQAEIEAAGFVLAEEIEIEGIDDNYFLRFENAK